MGKSTSRVEAKIMETDLFNPVREFLINSGYSVKSEVKDCDITAIKGEELLVVELKNGFNATLLIQAAKRQRVADKVFIAVPMPKKGIFTRKWKDICYLVRRLELGLIVVSFLKSGPQAEVVLNPEPFDREQSRRLNRKKRNSIITEIQGRHLDLNKGGSTRRKLVTAYMENAIQISCYLKKYGPLTLRQLKELGTGTKTGSILQKNFYGWFQRVSKGLYQISPKGVCSLDDYPELVDYYLKELAESQMRGINKI
mgnify:CR=1 FL=1